MLTKMKDLWKQNNAFQFSMFQTSSSTMFETSKHVPKTEKSCCVFKNIYRLVLSRPFGKMKEYITLSYNCFEYANFGVELSILVIIIQHCCVEYK